MNGILNVNKPSGVSSHDVVVVARKRLGIEKIGHGGTLDPQATGIILLLVGKATKVAQFITQFDKEYIVRMRFGAVTLTQDAWGKILKEKDASMVNLSVIKAALPSFIGKVKQTPPLFSALHYRGQRLYKLARKGIIIKPKSKMVHIYKIDPLRFYNGQRPEFEFRVVCSSGTYIRSLCHSLGEKVGVGGYLVFLKRIRIGPYKISDSVDLDGIKKEKIFKIDGALSFMPSVEVDEDGGKRITNGGFLKAKQLIKGEPFPGALLRVYGPSLRLLAVAKCVDSQEGLVIKPVRVF
jgi:tRNA pseudouridine55 synthase